MEEWAIGLVAVVAVIAAVVLAVMYVAVFLYVVAALAFSVVLGLADAVTSARFLPGCPWVMWAVWGAVIGLFVGLWAEAKNLGGTGWRPLLVSTPIIAMVAVAMVATRVAPLPDRLPSYRPRPKGMVISDRATQDYVLPDSAARDISSAELEALGLSDRDLCIARNEVFARHGLAFGSRALSQHFESRPWYKATTSNSGAIWTQLSSVERRNIEHIREVEARRKSPYLAGIGDHW